MRNLQQSREDGTDVAVETLSQQAATDIKITLNRRKKQNKSMNKNRLQT